MDYSEEDLKNRGINLISGGKIYEVLDLIRRLPYVCLTSKSITALQNFLSGYLFVAGLSDTYYHPGEPNLDEFKYWILAKDPDGKTGLGIGNPYSRILLMICDNDEEKAFDMFFEYLDEFRRTR